MMEEHVRRNVRCASIGGQVGNKLPRSWCKRPVHAFRFFRDRWHGVVDVLVCSGVCAVIRRCVLGGNGSCCPRLHRVGGIVWKSGM